MTRARPAALAALLALAAPLAAQPKAEPLVEQVRAAIDRGVRFLRAAEGGRGNWESEFAAVIMPGGPSSLALLALLNAGVPPDDPVVQRGLESLRKKEPEDTYVVGLQTMVFAEAGFARDKPLIQRNVDWLLRARQGRGANFSGWSYKLAGGSPDNSNTQYALLGLHAGKQAGAVIDAAVWKEIQDFYARTQTDAGAWSYHPNGMGEGPRLTMTVAGLCGLYIAGMELTAGRQKLRPDGVAENCGVYEENKPVAKALGWIGRNFTFQPRMNQFYNIYGIERAGRLSGQRFLAGFDWYRDGCQVLVGLQGGDGSWGVRNQGFDAWVNVSTSFALLFLSKGRTPVLISKFAYGAGEGWNNKHSDARHLAGYAARELFKKQPVAWQVFDVRKTDLSNPDLFNEYLAGLLQSPILYLNGHDAPRLSGVQKQLLKRYIEEGGFVLAEACCGSAAFAQGFKDLLAEPDMFPETPLRPLPPEHPVWRQHALVPPDQFDKLEGLDLGCKTVVVLSPQPLAGWWEENLHQSGRGELAFKLAGNVIAYATGMERPKPRLTPVEVAEVADDKAVPRGYLKAGQLRHEGDWQPAPRAVRNLMAHARKSLKLDVALQPEELAVGHPDLIHYKFLYMHGRNEFKFADRDLANLRANLEAGGLLFADACCGKEAFDRSFRAFAKQLFPNGRLEAVPLNDELYGKELNGEPLTGVRCRRERAGGGAEAEYQTVPPFLEGVKVNGRWAVLYSKYDVGCALEKHQSADCKGHDHDSALRLAAAALLYGLGK